VDTVYTKGDLLCIQYKDGMIVKYPLRNVFSVAGMHGSHWGSTRERRDMQWKYRRSLPWASWLMREEEQ